MFFPRSLVQGPFWGVPQSFPGGTPVPGSFPGHWSQVLSRGNPSPGWAGTPVLARDTPGLGYPPARSRWGTPSQVWSTPWPGMEYPSIVSTGVSPSQKKLGYPKPSQNEVPPFARNGVLPSKDRTGVSPSQFRMGYPPAPGTE